MSWPRSVNTTVFGNRLGLQILSSSVSGSGRGGAAPDVLLGPEDVKVGVTTAEIDSLATFYSQIFRSKVGDTVILLCDGLSCALCGGDAVRDAVMSGVWRSKCMHFSLDKVVKQSYKEDTTVFSQEARKLVQENQYYGNQEESCCEEEGCC